jgi:hypothetical protein
MPSSVIPKRSTPDDAEGVPVRHERDVSNIRLVPSAVNHDDERIAQLPDSSGAQAGQRPQAVRNARSKRERRALTPPSTATQFTRDGRVIRGNQEERCDADCP